MRACFDACTVATSGTLLVCSSQTGNPADRFMQAAA